MREIFIIDESGEGKRLDVFLDETIQGITRSQIKKSIEQSLTLVNGEKVKAGKSLRVGDVVSFEELTYETDVIPEDIPLDIIFEDDDFAIINKPQGMTVHPAPGNYTGTLVNALLYHFNGKVSDIGGKIRPGIVHRIDKDTSGLLVVAKNNESHLSLAKQIAEKTCHRQYVALVEGVVKDENGIVDQPIGRSKTDRKKMAICPDGKRAVTHYSVLERFKNYTLMQFDLETGRTHQIRVHMAYRGNPVAGDTVYGGSKNSCGFQGQCLHAMLLGFVHPVTNEYMEFSSELPDYFKDFLGRINK